MPVLHALRNLLLAALRDPLWAFLSLLLAPFRADKYLLQSVFALLVVGLLLFGAVGFAADTLGVRNTALHTGGDIAALAVLLALLWRFVSSPLLTHFGDAGADSHGTARFADAAEVAALTRGERPGAASPRASSRGLAHRGRDTAA